jgi:hypothetical protein
MSAMDAPTTPVEPVQRSAIDRLVDEYRLRCLWFLRADYYPSTDAERIRVLQYIERHGDRDAYRRAREMRRWLSQSSSARSAVS